MTFLLLKFLLNPNNIGLKYSLVILRKRGGGSSAMFIFSWMKNPLEDDLKNVTFFLAMGKMNDLIHFIAVMM